MKFNEELIRLEKALRRSFKFFEKKQNKVQGGTFSLIEDLPLQANFSYVRNVIRGPWSFNILKQV